MQRSLFRSLTSNWFGLVAAILVGFLLSPVVVHALGRETYGLLTLVVAITGQFAVLEFGIRSATVRFLSEGWAKQDREGTATVFHSALAIAFGSALLAILLALIVVGSGTELVQGDLATQTLFISLFLLYTIDAAVDLALGPCDAALASAERYDLLNLINVTRLVASASITIWILHRGGGIIEVALVAVSARLIQRWITIAVVRTTLGLSVRIQHVARAQARQLLLYGRWAFVILLATRIIYQVDTLVVGALLDTSAIAVYAISLILVEQVRQFGQSAATILTPRFTSLTTTQDTAGRTQLFRKWTEVGALLALGLGLPLLITGPDFITLWMGPGFEDSGHLLRLLTLPFFFVLPAAGCTQLLYATGEHRIAALLLSTEAVANLSLSILLGKTFGLVGIAVGTVIPALIFRGFVTPMLVAPRAQLSLADYLAAVYLRFLPLALGHCALLLTLQEVLGAARWMNFLLNNALGVCCFAMVSYRCILSQDDRAYLWRRLRRG